MDTFAALSLATDYPTRGVLQRKPEPRGTPVITPAMWKMIVAQSLYQITVIFVLHYRGGAFFANSTEDERGRLQTTAFNTYIFMQLFNQTNCRTADSRLNVFEGILRNPWFFFVQAVTVTGQILIVMFGGNAFQTHRPTGAQWATSVIIGLMTLPLGTLVRLYPDRWFLLMVTPIRKLFRLRMRRKRRKEERKAQAPAKPGFLRRAVSVIKRETAPPRPIIPTTDDDSNLPTLEEMKLHRTSSRTSLQRQTATGDINLTPLIEAAKAQQPDPRYMFEVHPDTQKDDPVIMPEVIPTDGIRVPPSQDEGHLQYLGSYEDNAVMRSIGHGL